jgi:hypothetical protein
VGSSNQLLNDSETAARIMLDGRQANIWTAMPAIIESIDLEAMTIEAQPVIQGVVTDSTGAESFVNLPLLVDVPICFPKGGGFVLTFPLAIGDEVLIVIANRCIDSWWQSGGIGVPLEDRMHDLSDGFAIPGPYSQPEVVPAISATDVQLRNYLGTEFISIGASGQINLVTTTGKIKMANTAQDLLTILNGMITLMNTLTTDLSAFATTASTDPIAVVTAGAAATLVTALTAYAASLTAYKTTGTGALLT